MGGNNVDLGQLLAGVDVAGRGVDSGRGDLAIWLDWKAGRVVSATTRMDLSDLALHGPEGELKMHREQALLGFARRPEGLRIRYAGPAGAQARVDVRGKGAAREISARALHLNLSRLVPWLTEAPGLPPALSKWLFAARPDGTLDQGRLEWSAQRGLASLDAQFHGLTLQAAGHRPGLGPLRGHLMGDAEAVSLDLPAQAVTLSMPGTLQQPIVLTSLNGAISAWQQDRDWHIGSGGITFSGKEFSGQVRGAARMPGADGMPYMNLYFTLGRTDMSVIRRFLPSRLLPEKPRKWLDRALVKGVLDHAEGLIHGDLGDWPFNQQRGRFEARGEISGLTLDYAKQWPRVEDVHAVASFVDDGMLVKADAGHAGGNSITDAVASIAHFRHGQLALSVQGKGTGASMLDFARNSPIAHRHASALKDLKLGGTSEFDFGLVLPFSDLRNYTLAGEAKVKGLDVDNADWGLSMRGLAGTLHFNGRGLHGEGLPVRFNGVPSTLDLALGPGATGDPDKPVQVAIHGIYDMPALIKGRPVLAPLAQVASGSAAFDIGFAITDSPKDQVRQVLTVDSGLDGMALDLPVPLDKPASVHLPMHLALQLPVSGGDLSLSLGSLVQARARLPTTAGAPLALSVRLGDQMPDSLPARGIRIRGHGKDLNVSGWLQRALDARRSPQGPPMQLDGVDVNVDRALMFGATFKPLHLKLAQQPGQVRMTLDGPQVKGTLTLPTTDLYKRGIVAHLQRLYWPDESAKDPGASNAQANGHPALAAAASAPAQPAPATIVKSDAAYANTGINPATIPPLHISVGDLRLGNAHLGEARFESWPTPSGMHIDQMRTHTRDVQVMATGDWLGDAHDSRTHMRIDFGAQNLGSLLNTLGFQGLFTGGQTRAHLDASWPGEPSSVALARMSGNLGVQVSKGRIPEVQPGMGRLLGLMAVTELPRRLSLDFGDVFGKGLGFDSITGHFKLDDGVAHTDDLKIKGSAAEITITGRTNMRNKTYDQHVLVIPHVGNSLPVVGALALGPVGAAAGLAVQGLLGKGLNKAASARYTLTGSWQHPKITLIDKDEIHTPAATPKAPRASAPSATSPMPAPLPPQAAPAASTPTASQTAPEASMPSSVRTQPAAASSNGR
ncbi:YhdP family protein [Oleiagrimonas sp.]|uniref:YhdP family protein n=1 Tax=Oleiagrimonas sp. TaxID=2010330 RepID=UPI0026292F35|nr:YhdP family protein [Oleiagrimonas sp.]MDA3912786.1 YhdP family protein [Oleiagrimonas sp.]